MPVRVVCAVAVLVSGAVHLKLWFDGFRGVALIGPSFMLNAVAAVVIAVLLLLWRHWAPPLVAAGFGVATLGAFVLSTTVGLFGFHEHWQGPYVWIAAAAEVVAILTGLVVIRGTGRLNRRG